MIKRFSNTAWFCRYLILETWWCSAYLQVLPVHLLQMRVFHLISLWEVRKQERRRCFSWSQSANRHPFIGHATECVHEQASSDHPHATLVEIAGLPAPNYVCGFDEAHPWTWPVKLQPRPYSLYRSWDLKFLSEDLRLCTFPCLLIPFPWGIALPPDQTPVRHGKIKKKKKFSAERQARQTAGETVW